MKDNEIVEVLPDGTVYHFDLDICNAAAGEVLEQLWAKEGQQLGFDYTATVFSLFVSAIHILKESGWTAEDLHREVHDHAS